MKGVGRADILAVLFFVLMILGTIYFTGNFDGVPRIWDDNQIFRLKLDLQGRGLWAVMWDEQVTRFEDYSRFVPLFLVEKVLKAWAFGGNVVMWTAYNGVLACLSAAALYGAMRVLGYGVLVSMSFPFFALVGIQSVLWWKVIQGEGLGVLLFSLAILSLSLKAVTGDRVWGWLMVVFAALSTLCKESFIHGIPHAMVRGAKRGRIPRSDKEKLALCCGAFCCKRS